MRFPSIVEIRTSSRFSWKQDRWRRANFWCELKASLVECGDDGVSMKRGGEGDWSHQPLARVCELSKHVFVYSHTLRRKFVLRYFNEKIFQFNIGKARGTTVVPFLAKV